jgi:hypothetical protein
LGFPVSPELVEEAVKDRLYFSPTVDTSWDVTEGEKDRGVIGEVCSKLLPSQRIECGQESGGRLLNVN